MYGEDRAMFINRTKQSGEKLEVLSRDSRYDLACACATREDEHRRRSKEGKWVYPVTLPNGGTTYLFKTLLSNECVNNCKYCPLRANVDADRCSLSPEELAKTFLSYYRARRVSGLFLSSAVAPDADSTMERINRVALILRRSQFRGYIHLKVIPGSSDEAIKQALYLANAVSLNIESPGEDNFRNLTTSKDYLKDIIRPMELISSLRAKGSCCAHVHQTTQFVVGASGETDKQIVSHSQRLYKDLGLSRVYFSAYQRGAGDLSLPGECSKVTNDELLTREHRLYQVDWLMRKYGFSAREIPFDEAGNLSLTVDPKEMWAKQHPEFFPVNLNKDDRFRLLRVPGLGQVMVDRIFAFRVQGKRLRNIEDLGRPGKLLKKTSQYVVF